MKRQHIWQKVVTLALFSTLGFTSSIQANSTELIHHLDDISYLNANQMLPDSLSEFLAKLAPQLQKNYVLIHTSQSLQPSHPLTPRVITYHPETKLIVAYSGLRDQGGNLIANNAELMQYDEQRGQFDLATLDFTDTAPEFTRNPANCTTCHSASRHPIWFTYPLWPGAYDVRDTHVPTSRIETTYFSRFLELAATDPLYENLVDRENYFRRSSSTSFNDFLNPINRDFIGRELRRLENFEPFKYVLAAALSGGCHEDLDTFLPEDLRNTYFTTPYHYYRENTAELMLQSFRARFNRFVRLNDGVEGQYPYYIPTNFLMQGHYRHHVSGLRYILDQQSANVHRLFFALDRRSFQTPWASALITSRIPGVRPESCSAMREKSLASLENWQQLEVPYPYWN